MGENELGERAKTKKHCTVESWLFKPSAGGQEDKTFPVNRSVNYRGVNYSARGWTRENG